MGPRRGKADDRQQTLQPSAIAQAAAAEAQQQQLQQLQQQQESFCIAGHDCYFPHKPYGECVELPACSHQSWACFQPHSRCAAETQIVHEDSSIRPHTAESRARATHALSMSAALLDCALVHPHVSDIRKTWP